MTPQLAATISLEARPPSPGRGERSRPIRPRFVSVAAGRAKAPPTSPHGRGREPSVHAGRAGEGRDLEGWASHLGPSHDPSARCDHLAPLEVRPPSPGRGEDGEARAAKPRLAEPGEGSWKGSEEGSKRAARSEAPACGLYFRAAMTPHRLRPGSASRTRSQYILPSGRGGRLFLPRRGRFAHMRMCPITSRRRRSGRARAASG